MNSGSTNYLLTNAKSRHWKCKNLLIHAIQC